MSKEWECAARKSVGANDPQDCGFPHCGCCPDAAEVIHALAESGELMDDETMGRHRRARDGIVHLLTAIGPFASAAEDFSESTRDAALVAIPFTVFSFRRARKAVDEVSRIALSDARGEDFIDPVEDLKQRLGAAMDNELAGQTPGTAAYDLTRFIIAQLRGAMEGPS